jgi:uncharacterized repeat protein (TIGR01451 family)
MLLALMLGSAMSVHATEAEITVQVRASATEVSVGDTVEFTVLTTGSGVVAMQFNLELPQGLSYVPNSGATPENLAQKLDVPAADWTEQSMMFTFYNDIGITFAKGTEILHFTCVAEKEGEWAVNLYELLPFNENFEEFTPKLQVQTITVREPGAVDEGPDPVTTEPAIPEATTPVTPTEPDPVIPEDTNPIPEDEAQPTDPNVPEDEKGDDTLTEQEVPATPETEAPSQSQQASKSEKKDDEPKNNTPWITSGAVVVLIIGSVIAFILMKKKKA